MSGTWIACADEMPDDCTSVMTFSPDSSEPVWPGFHDEQRWIGLDSWPMNCLITHWQHFPEPPEV